MTDTRPAPTATAEAPPQAALADPAGLAGWLMTSDHKRVGRLWIVTSLLFLIGAGVLAALLGLEGADTGIDVLNSSETFGQIYTLHGEMAVLLFLVPLLLGVATFVVPLQVGASEIAFPRGAATAYWLYLVSGGTLIGAYLADGGQNGPPDAHEAIDLWLLALIGIVLATVIALVCLCTTVLALRAGGMTLLRTPVFSWSVLVGGSLTLLTAPVLAARLIGMYASHHFGGDLGAYGEISWFWSVPQVYLLVVVAAGIALEIVPVVARQPLPMHGAGLIVIGVLGVFGLGAWAQVPVTFDDFLYVAIGLAIVLPALALLGTIGDTLRRGRPQAKVALLFAVGTALLLLLGAIAGALLAIDPLDLHGTVWETGQWHLIVFGAGALGGLGALWWWAPKLWGVELHEGVGALAFLTTFLGALLLGVPDLVNGLANDLPLRTFRFDEDGGAAALNGVTAAGGVLLALSGLLVVAALLAALRRRNQVVTEDNPWGGYTLEWSTASPPVPANFTAAVPPVTSATPLLTAEGSAS